MYQPEMHHARRVRVIPNQVNRQTRLRFSFFRSVRVVVKGLSIFRATFGNAPFLLRVRHLSNSEHCPFLKLHL